MDDEGIEIRHGLNALQARLELPSPQIMTNLTIGSPYKITLNKSIDHYTPFVSFQYWPPGFEIELAAGYRAAKA
jgi:hypothetical protein